jgi:hypothetical protein
MTWNARPQGRRGLAATAALLTALTVPAAAQRGPAPAKTNLPADVLSVACAPGIAFELPDRSLRITGGQDATRRRVWGPGDLITMNAGTDHGIEVGQQYFVRRVQVENAQKVSRITPASVATVGWIKVWAIEKEMSLATVVHACDTMEVGDYLEPFVMPTVAKPTAQILKPERDNYARIMFGTDLRRSFAKGDYFIIDRGTNFGLNRGDRFVVYRDKALYENFLYSLGDAVAVDVQEESATLQVTVSRDAFMEGDYVALRKLPPDTK